LSIASTPRVSFAASLVLVATMGLVASQAASAPAPSAGRTATPGELRTLSTDIATQESNWRTRSEQSFPGDDWSQRDDFHAQERDKVNELAAAQKLPVEQVLRAVDLDVRASARHGGAAPGSDADPRGARAVPCKPRPFYD
jgi:hypothetical protein